MVHQELGKEENKANFNGVKAQLGWGKKVSRKKFEKYFGKKNLGSE